MTPSREIDRDAVVAALQERGWNVSRAARALGASRRTLQNRMREYALPRGTPGRRKRALPYGAISRLSRPIKVAGAIAGAAALVGAVALGVHRFRGSQTVVGSPVPFLRR